MYSQQVLYESLWTMSPCLFVYLWVRWAPCSQKPRWLLIQQQHPPAAPHSYWGLDSALLRTWNNARPHLHLNFQAICIHITAIYEIYPHNIYICIQKCVFGSLVAIWPLTFLHNMQINLSWMTHSVYNDRNHLVSFYSRGEIHPCTKKMYNN